MNTDQEGYDTDPDRFIAKTTVLAKPQTYQSVAESTRMSPAQLRDWATPKR